MNHALLGTVAGVLLLGLGHCALADEAAIRKNLPERIPQLRQIDEVSKAPIPGLFEVRVNGAEIYYTDGEANFLIQGNVYDTRQRRNLTEERVDKLTAIDFSTLPLKDAFATVRGNGKRKLVVFEDPNCSFCKKFERDLVKLNNVTVYTFLFPILSPDSMKKSEAIWCAKDRTKVWQDWMVRDALPTAGNCDTSAIQRNVELGRKYRVTGTPTLVFVDGSRVPGAVGADKIDQMLNERGG
jgi:thiol:disulfide interchange protein DsbC